MKRVETNFLQRWSHKAAVLGVAVGGALACFLVLPLLQVFGERHEADLEVQRIDTAELPPPPPPIEEEKQEEKPDEQKSPELTDAAPPLDLAALEMALDPGSFGDGLGGAGALQIQGLGGGKADAVDALFSFADLDQKPRAVHKPEPVLTSAMRRKLPVTVRVVFVVDQQGHVENPIVQEPGDPAIDALVLTTVRQWRFEPGKREGQPVRFRMRQTFKFEG